MYSVPMVAPILQAQVVWTAPVQVGDMGADANAAATAAKAAASALARPFVGNSSSQTATPSKPLAQQRFPGGEQQAGSSAQTGGDQQLLAGPVQGKRRGQVATPGRAKARKTSGKGSGQSDQMQHVVKQWQGNQRALRAAQRQMQKVASQQGRKVNRLDLRLWSDGKVRETATGPDGHKVVLQELALERHKQTAPPASA